MTDYLISSCVFTSRFPERSKRIRDYASENWDLEVVRCCVPKYKITEFNLKMPEGELRDSWSSLPDTGQFIEGDRVYSICHNCLNIIDETKPGVETRSVWELIDSDDGFDYPDMSGTVVTVQDCWRSRDRFDEQAAVRHILDRMNVEWKECQENHSKTEFCGNSLYKAQPPRNPKIAPKHYVENAVGKFIPHSEEEQKKMMEEYCSRIKTDKVICYCHYCLEGLLMGDSDAYHLAELLF